jgi:hypothetical protein
MNRQPLILTVLACALAVSVASPRPAGAEVRVDVRGEIGFFHEALAPYGSWVTVARFGDVWVPDVPPWWRPYSDGHWAYTDDGWAWVDNEPWGWAAFHYGRWAFDDEYGWVWVPGTVWAPAWVAWRFGDGYVGWAPLPPDIGWRAGIGLGFAGIDFDAVIAPHAWCFVDEGHFTAPGIRAFLAPPARNVTFVRVTRNITDYTVVNSRVFDRGVDVRRIERVTGRPLPRLRIVARDVPGPGRVTGRELNVYRPSLTGPPPRWRGPRIVQRTHTEDLHAFDAHWNDERARLRRLQDEDAARYRNRLNREDLQRRHEAEMQALSRERLRERKVLEQHLQHRPPVHENQARGKGRGGHGPGGGND